MLLNVVLLGSAAAVIATSAMGAEAVSRPADMPAVVMLQSTDLGLVFADPEGMVLYAHDRNRICRAECLETWRPVSPPPERPLKGSWGVTRRPDGPIQLTYQGRALYRYVAEIAPGATGGDGISSVWHAVAYTPPAPRSVTPSGVIVVWAKTTFVYADQAGQTLYVPNRGGGDGCATGFSSFAAGLAAQRVGDWQPVDVYSGVRQWAYKGQLTYVGGGPAAEPGSGSCAALAVGS